MAARVSIANGDAKAIQRGGELGIGAEKGQHREIVAWMKQREEGLGLGSRKLLSGGRTESQRDAVGQRPVGPGYRQLSLRLVLIQQDSRRVFRLLHVGFVERVHGQERSGDCRRHFPANKLGPDRRQFRELDRDDRQVRGFQGAGLVGGVCPAAQAHEQSIAAIGGGRRGSFADNRNDPDAVFSRALCHELLNPEAEGAEFRRQEHRELVASRTGGGGHREPQRHGGIEGDVAIGLGRREHGRTPAKKRLQVLTHQRGRHETEERERRVSAADVGGIDEEVAELFGARPTGEARVFVGDRDEVIGPARHTGLLEAASKIRGERVGLDRPSRLARENVEGFSRRGDRGAHRRGIGRIQHVQLGPAWPNPQHAAKNLRRQTRAAHAEQHDVREPVTFDGFGECLEAVQRFRHEDRRGQPPEPVGDRLLHDRIGAPGRWLTAPQSHRRAFGSIDVRPDDLGERSWRNLQGVLRGGRAWRPCRATASACATPARCA